MSKILRLREWLTVEEAAKRLTISTQEEISEADLLRLGLDGHLTLSVHFVNHADGRPVTIAPVSSEESDSKIREQLQDFLKEHPEHEESEEKLADLQKFTMFYRGDLLPGGERVLIYEGDGQHPVTLEGVWDLMMLGAETLDVEHAYQRLVGGVSVDLVCLTGPLVASPDGSRCFQILDSYNQQVQPNPSVVINRPFMSKQTRESLNKMSEILGPWTGKPPTQEGDLGWDYERVWYPASGLPKDHQLVVRSNELKNLERKLLEPEAEPEKPLHPTERKSVAQLVAALAAAAGLDLSAPYAADETLRMLAAKHGVELPNSPETVVKYFKLAAPYLTKH